MMSRHVIRWSLRFGLVGLVLLAAGMGQALAATSAVCNPAAGNGIGNGNGLDDPVDYGAYCWVDFSGYSNSQAFSTSGQDFIVTLPGGATLTFTLKVSNYNTAGDELFAVPVPSWSGAAFGNSAFINIPGNPILYQNQANQNAPEDTITLSNLNLSANGSPDLPFVFVAADGESTNVNESLSFTTAGAPWQLVASPGEASGRVMPTLTGVDTQTVNEAGQGSGDTGSYVFTTDNSPGTVSATLNGSGLQGVIFGLKFHSIDLALTQTYTGDNFPGGSGSFQVTTSNTVSPIQHPPITPQPIQIVDTLPTGLTYTGFTGSSWTCSASGLVVTCNLNSPTLLDTSKSLPPLSLNVQIAGTGLAGVNTLTNTALIKDVTPGYVFDTNQNNNTGAAQIALIHPDLSTSTKTVVDINGGDAESGDVLEYTITLKESAGLTASNVSVTDDMPAHVGSLSVTNDAGGTDNSSTTGGANGNGQLDISGISVPANGTKTIVYDVTIAAGTGTGITIDNTATINNPNGNGAAPAAPTITVALSQVPVSGKILYVYTSNSTLTRTPQTGGGGDITIGRNNSHDWILTPALAGDLTLTGGSTVSVSMLVECTDIRRGDCRSGNRLHWTAALYDGGTQIGSTSGSTTFNDTDYALETANISIGSTTTVPAGHQLTLRIANTSSSNRDMQVEQYDGGNRSEVTLNQSTVINVDSVGTYTDATCATPVTQNYQTQNVVYLCAVVSDPFGSADIDPTTGGTAPTIAITDAASSQQIMAAMNLVADSGATTKTFEYTYTVPASPAIGTWTASVTAWEGTEHTVNRSGSGTFDVQAPKSDLSTATKSVLDMNGGDAQPGDILQYTITLTETAGIAATGISVTDDMPANVGSLTVTNNAGGTDNSTPAGGTNGTGKLDISGISVPASGSKTIVCMVTIASGATPGTTIDNTATITNTNGKGATPAAPTVTVSQSQVPASGNKLLYAYDNQGLSRTPQTAGGTAVDVDYGTPLSWTMTTALAKPLTIKANSTISVNLLVQCGQTYQGSCWSNPDWTAALYDNTVSAGTRIGSVSPQASFNHGSYTQETANISVGSSDVTIPAGHKLILQITNNNDGDYPPYTTMQVEQYSGSSRSTVSLDVSTVINVDSVGTFSEAGCTTPVTPVYETHSTVFICAVVSDPFGSGDIDPYSGGTAPTLTITDADATQQLNAASMTQVASDTSTKTYEYTYTVPTSPPATLALGGWTASVTAWEGTEHTVNDTGNGSFDVGAPNLVILKSVSVVSGPVHGTNNPKALPGSKMRYTIMVTNQGKGPVDNNQLVVTDAIPANTAFVVGSVSGSGAGSGLSNLATGDIKYSDDGGATWTYTPAGNPGQTDPAVTNIRFSPQGSMNGKTGAIAPAYTIAFDIIIE